MLTLYTAIGTLKFQKEDDGQSYPCILNNEQEYRLSDSELLLWSCLAFQILQIHELKEVYKNRAAQLPQAQEPLFSPCLNRLLLRGLIVKGEGMTGVDALYRLLNDLYIFPVVNTFPLRLFTCIRLLMEKKIKPADIGKYLKKTPHTPIEETILRLAQTTPLTTAELASCVESRKEPLPPEQILKELYEDPDTTSQTISNDVQIRHIQYPVLQAVGNLYLNKQISFQRF